MPLTPKYTEDQKEAAGWVLHWYGVPGHYPPGGFSSLIIQAYSKADPSNKARLRLAFPEIAEAMDIVNNDKDWLLALQERLDGGLEQAAQRRADGLKKLEERAE